MRKLIIIGVCLIVTYLPLHAEEKYTKEINLGHWGIKTLQEIRYVSLGLVHMREGIRVDIFDIRKKRPKVTPFKGHRGKIPDYKGDVFLLSHYNHGNVNRLGGYFNGFFRKPSSSVVSIAQGKDGVRSLLNIHNLAPKTFCGFWIHLYDFKKPPSERWFLDSRDFNYLTFNIRSDKRGGKYILQIADRHWEKREDSLPVRPVGEYLKSKQVTKKWQQAWIPLSDLPSRLDRSQLASIVFQVKGEGPGNIYLKDLAFSKTLGAALPKAPKKGAHANKIGKGMWLWETLRFARSPEEIKTLMAFLKKYEINSLYLQIPYEAHKKNEEWIIEWNPEELTDLLSQLGQNNIEVYALDGDAKFALRQWHGRELSLVKQIMKFNKELPERDRFVGIRYDIEPYLLEGFSGPRKKRILTEYLEILVKTKKLLKGTNLLFGVDIPFWFDGLNEYFEPIALMKSRPMTEAILDIVDNMTIMDYRTFAYGADGVIAHGKAELDYAKKIGKKVFIGLETVWLPNERQMQFTEGRGNGSGIYIEPPQEGKAKIYWYSRDLWDEVRRDKNLRKKGIFLGQRKFLKVNADKVTFHNKKPQDLFSTMEDVEYEFRDHPAFAGFALHSYESLRPFLAKDASRQPE